MNEYFRDKKASFSNRSISKTLPLTGSHETRSQYPKATILTGRREKLA